MLELLEIIGAVIVYSYLNHKREQKQLLEEMKQEEHEIRHHVTK